MFPYGLHGRLQVGKAISRAATEIADVIVAVKLLPANKPGALLLVPIHKGVVSEALRG